MNSKCNRTQEGIKDYRNNLRRLRVSPQTVVDWHTEQDYSCFRRRTASNSWQSLRIGCSCSAATIDRAGMRPADKKFPSQSQHSQIRSVIYYTTPSSHSLYRPRLCSTAVSRNLSNSPGRQKKKTYDSGTFTHVCFLLLQLRRQDMLNINKYKVCRRRYIMLMLN